MADRERVRIGLRRKGDARVLGRAIIEGDEQPEKRGGPRGAVRDRDARVPTEDLALTYGQAKQIRLAPGQRRNASFYSGMNGIHANE